MKCQTIHSNALGDVVNESSATGFRITDNQGRVTEVRTESGMVKVRHSNRVLVLPIMDEPVKFSGKEPTGVIMDELARPMTCYQCGRNALWLAPDSRCSKCTRLTPDEV